MGYPRTGMSVHRAGVSGSKSSAGVWSLSIKAEQEKRHMYKRKKLRERRQANTEEERRHCVHPGYIFVAVNKAGLTNHARHTHTCCLKNLSSSSAESPSIVMFFTTIKEYARRDHTLVGPSSQCYLPSHHWMPKTNSN